MGKFIDMTGWKMWEHGVPDSRLTVIEKGGVSKDGHICWLCECSCDEHNQITATGSRLRKGETLSCGCIRAENAYKMGKMNFKRNNVDLSGEYGIGWANNSNIQFEFDLEDYPILANHCWSTCTDHYGYTRLETAIKIGNRYKRISMAQFLTGEDDIDHVDKNPMNNKRSNFRVATRSQQTVNQGLRSHNTSGITGVSWSKQEGLWKAYITVNKNKMHLGGFANKENAIIARLRAEAKYFKEFAPQQHLFEQYNITNEENKNELC